MQNLYTTDIKKSKKKYIHEKCIMFLHTINKMDNIKNMLVIVIHILMIKSSHKFFLKTQAVEPYSKLTYYKGKAGLAHKLNIFQIAQMHC